MVRLMGIKHAPDTPNNMLSVGRLTDMEHVALFTNEGVKFWSQNGTIFTEGCKVGCIYVMHAWICPTIQMDFTTVAKPRSWDSWHWVLGHINIGTIKLMKACDLVTRMDVDLTAPVTQCVACIQSKHHVEPFPKWAEDTATLIGNLSISDVWGLANTEGPVREWYFYSFTDAKSRYFIIYLSHAKDGVLERFKEYAALIETQTGRQLKRLHGDGSSEYINALFRTFCAKKGIIMEFTAPYSPAQNGIAERLNRTLLEHARAMLFAKQTPKMLWPEAVAYACYIKNRMPT